MNDPKGLDTGALSETNSLTDQRAYYDRRWAGFRHINLYELERCNFFLRSITNLKVKQPRICDLGCGTGWLAGILSTIGPTTGVELSPVAVEAARGFFPMAEFVCADATKWNPGRDLFDVVVSQEVLEHIEDKPAYLRTVHEILRPGGYLLMTTPNLDVLNAIPSKERKTIWEIQPVELPVSRRQLSSLLAQHGFTVLQAASVIGGYGQVGVQRLLNSHKFHSALAVLGLRKRAKRFLEQLGYGMYLTTVARKDD